MKLIKKPTPIKAFEISKSLRINPEDIIYVSDTGIDMQTANNANLLTVGVSWGFRDKEKLIDNSAKHIINNPLDLIELL
ncbi:HAD family hydrolase [Thalassobellus citreus]|uniref:HAD family hydrolase n=1 Tax=Thalassobellus citreus TaxID=3367752 RepID=UPI0037B35676